MSTIVGSFDDVLLGDQRDAAERALADDEAAARRRRVIAIVAASVGIVALVVVMGALAVSFLQGLSDGLSPR